MKTLEEFLDERRDLDEARGRRKGDLAKIFFDEIDNIEDAPGAEKIPPMVLDFLHYVRSELQTAKRETRARASRARKYRPGTAMYMEEFEEVMGSLDDTVNDVIRRWLRL